MMVMIEALHKVIKWLHFPIEVMPVCVRRYAAYPLSLHHIEGDVAKDKPNDDGPSELGLGLTCSGFFEPIIPGGRLGWGWGDVAA